ncbi:hypothetical protein L917_11379 [Phytophthora nicotianae]|uniref:RxLR effector protein n=2 Tax=Phytophthora nicotianae TaxID=4792 RepID=V9EYD2_PHYNI|nr:hypothetical protein F443_11884 [Phytophthora nicotianae P1569]ETL36518.1 hypothetical protein L916_11514 [Phytophthora nicotianae]ETL89735.1 hypothetical protein L917_11379 [Phytophthora nicotianae]ETM43003.1 hypothetical protein L914_11431 [Phytophthora nicotianae]
MRFRFALLIIQVITFVMCGALSAETSSSALTLPKLVHPEGVPSNSLLDSDNQKRRLRSRDAEGEERQLKSLKSAGERVIEWLRKNKGLEDVKDSMMVSSVMDKLDPRVRTYKKFGNALLKRDEPKDLYKKWNQSKLDKFLGCLQPPCVAP